MLSRVVITACLLLVSLVGDAKLTVPDSLLTIQNAYRYNIVSPDTAQAILSTLRERKMEPEWRIDFAEGDLNVNMRQFRKALPFYQKVNDNKAVDDSTHVQLLLMKRMMDCYDAIYNDEALVEVMLRLRKKAQSCGDKAFEAMTYFTSGRWHHYHGQREKGYQSCLDAVEMMKSSDYPSKHIELRNFYAELLRMYAHDGRYDEAIRMSQLQEAEARQPSPASILNARERGLRRVYALRACGLCRSYG